MMVDECVTYFTELRDSFRDILNEIDKRETRENIVTSDSFWRSFVIKAVSCGKVETEIWDFKQTLSLWHAPKGEPRHQAKVAFARDVASFANAGGGCLIIGVSNTREIVGIGGSPQEIENRIKTAHDGLAEHLNYPRELYHVRQVPIPASSGESNLCLVVVVGQACEPVGVKDGGHYSFPVRCGTGTIDGDPRKLQEKRTHEKSDNFEFLSELVQFIRDN
jgi:predicted HTH transcriptional regulator